MRKKILITGVAGFIGSSFSKYLDTQKYEIYGIDDLSTGNKKNLSNKIKFIKLDLSITKNFKLLPNKIDYIFHFAGQSSGEKSFYDVRNDFRRNFLTTYNLLSFYKEKKIKKFIFASSMSVYGNLGRIRAKETDICRPLSNYGKHKLLSEEILKMQTNINYVIFRFFNVYGPGQNLKDLKQGMVSIYMAQMIKHKKILVKGSLNRIRDFIYISDVNYMLSKSIKSNKFNNKIFNLGTGKSTTVKKLISLLINFEKKTYLNKAVSTPHDQNAIVANINKITKVNKFNPTPLKLGLKKFYNWAKLTKF
jgi:UDP-glucose 4-epimerase